MPAVRAVTSWARTNIWAYVGFTALSLISAAHYATNAFDRFDAVRHAGEYAREPFYLGDRNWGAVNLPEARAAGMTFGDAVLSTAPAKR